jgi:hypothetical protein
MHQYHANGQGFEKSFWSRMVKVWVGYECYYNGCDVWRSVKKIFDCEEKALVWQEDFETTEYDWREYTEMGVE